MLLKKSIATDEKNIPSAEKAIEKIGQTYSRIMSSGEAQEKLHSIPSDSWVADNYYLLCEVAEELMREKTKRNALLVYEIAAEIVAHTDGRVAAADIVEYVASCEKTKRMEEEALIYLCHMLKLALIKWIGDKCACSDKIYNERRAAEKIFREFVFYTEDENSIRGAMVLFDRKDTLTPVFAETVLRLSAEQDKNDALREALSKRLAEKEETIEDLIEQEHATRIALGVSIGNAIKSLHDLPSFDWEKIVSELSVTEQILRKDPSGIFIKMTSRARQEYLRIVRVCAKKKHMSPKKYAEEVLDKAQKEKRHIGEYIYKDYTKNNEFESFFIMFLFTSAILAFCPAVYTIRLSEEVYGMPGLLLGIFVVLLIITVSMNLSLALIQKMYTDKKMPFSLPEMEFNGKLPDDCKIMIVLPCLINSKKRADEMIDQLEAAYWANPQEGIFYMLLADFPESLTKTTENDRELSEYAQRKIKKLGERFSIYIRQRVFYKNDNKWMGYERKRGALIELNRAIISGDLPRVNYVLTVDADSIIPINIALKLAQIMHHPINRPKVVYEKGHPIVASGYGILQPAISISAVDCEKSTVFKSMFSQETGFDMYRCKTSDFYFDVCREGTFSGKGMYDPYVFNGVLDGSFEKNSILSHDLLEGSFIRTAFISDIHLYEGFPESYLGHVKREHRWIRGDWQLIPFLRNKFKNEEGVLKNNPLKFCSRFKIAMNLLRSLLPVSLFLIFLLGMIFLKRDAFLWIFITAVALLLTEGGKIKQASIKAACRFMILPYEFYYHADGIIKALWRTFHSRKNMLEWVVSSEAEKNEQNTAAYYCKAMWFNFAAAALMAPFLYGIPTVLWLAGPYLFNYLSKTKKKIKREAPKLTEAQKNKFIALAKKIWAFYADYATKEENYLPPDNVQFSPMYSVAHRTSPTNIGFLIISTVTAKEFDFISRGEMVQRLENIMNTLDKMEKWHGHIFNWCDTTTLQALEPKYVSCVDSGNLVACLLTAATIIERNKNQDSKEFAEIYAREKKLVNRMKNFALETDFKVLYDNKRKLFKIGYNLTLGEYSNSYYDMIMSEARLTSYVAMAKGDADSEHFSALARRRKEGKILLSWSGTVFEYVLPELFLESPYGSALKDSVYGMLELQQTVAGDRPWGVSESGYNAFDVNMNYKYNAFGLKALAVKRKHKDDTVIAPYACLMSACIIPNRAYENMEHLSRMGVEGKYGYFEAIDFTPGRKGVVESYMAHHQGMAMCGIANLLLDKLVSKAFGGMAMIAPVKVMLTERYIPTRAKNKIKSFSQISIGKDISIDNAVMPEQPVSILANEAEVLSNGKYSVVINAEGKGYSVCYGRGVDLNRGQSLAEGIVVYLNGKRIVPENCTAYRGSVECSYFTDDEEVIQSICAATEDNAEVRRFKITNKSENVLFEDIIIYCRIMMDYTNAYEAHPAYSGMFVTTEVLKNEAAEVCLKANRHKHKISDPFVCSYFGVKIDDRCKSQAEVLSFDTDMLSFKGRSDNSEFKLLGNTGIVLNPCFAVNIRLRVESGESCCFSVVMGMSLEEENVTEKVDKLHNTERAFELAETRCYIEREYIAFKKGDLQYFREYSSKLLYGKKYYSNVIKRKLWENGISGDNPIITVLIRKIENASKLERLVRMWCYYSFRGIKLDMVLAVFDNSDYISPIQELAAALSQKANWGCFPVRGDIFVVVPKEKDGAAPIIEASNLVFWL